MSNAVEDFYEHETTPEI